MSADAAAAAEHTFLERMLPYVVILSIAWTLFFIGWDLLGIPLGPGSPVHLH